MKRVLGLLMMGTMLVGCMADKATIGELLKKNPELITDAIKENPEEFIGALNEAVKVAQSSQRKKQEEAEKQAYEDSFKNPLEPISNTVFRFSIEVPLSCYQSGLTLRFTRHACALSGSRMLAPTLHLSSGQLCRNWRARAWSWCKRLLASFYHHHLYSKLRLYLIVPYSTEPDIKLFEPNKSFPIQLPHKIQSLIPKLLL